MSQASVVVIITTHYRHGTAADETCVSSLSLSPFSLYRRIFRNFGRKWSIEPVLKPPFGVLRWPMYGNVKRYSFSVVSVSCSSPLIRGARRSPESPAVTSPAMMSLSSAVAQRRSFRMAFSRRISWRATASSSHTYQETRILGDNLPDGHF